MMNVINYTALQLIFTRGSELKTLKKIKMIGASMAVCGLATMATAGTTVIDFESFDLSGFTFLDVGSPLVFNQPGVDVSIIQGGSLRVYDLFLFGSDPATTGQALLDSGPGFMNPDGTDIQFSTPVSDFSLRAGDFGSDIDSPLRIEAFDAGGLSLGVAMADWDQNQFPPFVTLSLNVDGISRIHYSSGGSFPSSTFIDDLTFTVPAPGAATLVGCAGLISLPRRR